MQVCDSTAQKMKFSIKDFFRKYDRIRSFLRIWLDLLKKSLMGNFIFCAVQNENVLFLDDVMVDNMSKIHIKPRA